MNLANSPVCVSLNKGERSLLGAERYDQGSARLTLVELMVVIAIIGVLASVAIPTFKGYIHRSKTAEVFTPAEALYFSYHVSTGLSVFDGSGKCGRLPNDACAYVLTAQGDLDGDGDMTYYYVHVGINENHTMYRVRGIKGIANAGQQPAAMWLFAAGLVFVRRRSRQVLI